MRKRPLNQSDYKARARVIKAMAHPSRLQVIDILSEGEQCVCELQKRIGSDMSTISKHLSLMRAAGLVTDRRQGMQVFYRLRVPCILRFFECVDSVSRGAEDVDARRVG